MSPRWLASASLALMLALAPVVRAVIILGDVTDPNGTYRNTTDFPSNLDQYIGTFGPYLGTPISSQYFVTANHIENAGGGVFTYNGMTYNVTEAGIYDDLAIWQIDQNTSPNPSFLTFAPLYTATGTDVGQPLVVIGRGTQRGTPVYDPQSNTNLVGWQWGPHDGITSWGTNTVAGIYNNGPQGAGGLNGNYLQYFFNNNGNPNTAIVSDEDSGGPVFVQDPADGIYKLDGTTTGVDEVSQTQGGGNFQASLFDSRGFYGGENNDTLVTGDNPVPLSSYATQLSDPDMLAFIDGVTGVPEPSALGLLLIFAPLALGRRVRRA